MPASVGFRVTGLAEVVAGLYGLAEDLDRLDLGGVAREAATLVASRAPRRTGTLAGSIRAEATPNRGAVVATVHYAGPVNYGWGTTPGAGFMAAGDRLLDARSPAIIDAEIHRKIRTRGL